MIDSAYRERGGPSMLWVCLYDVSIVSSFIAKNYEVKEVMQTAQYHRVDTFLKSNSRTHQYLLPCLVQIGKLKHFCAANFHCFK